jgi:hypothetical protein
LIQGAAAQEFLELSTNRYTGGVDTYLQVLTAQTLTLANERNAIDSLRRPPLLGRSGERAGAFAYVAVLLGSMSVLVIPCLCEVFLGLHLLALSGTIGVCDTTLAPACQPNAELMRS